MVWLTLAAASVAAAEPVPAVQFVDSGVLIINVPIGQTSASIDANVFNGTTESQLVTLDLFGVTGTGTDPSAQRLPGAPVPLAMARVDAGTVSDLQATIELPSTATGSYVGTLVVFADDGSLDRREFNLNVAAPPSSPSAANRLTRPLPETLRLSAWSLVPSPIAWLLPGESALVGLPHITSAEAVAVPLAGTDAIGRLGMTDGRLTVSGVDAAGEYSGKITVGAGDTEETTTVTVSVADFIVYPLIVLLIGLRVATLIDDFLTRRRPRAKLEIDLTTERERTQQAQSDMLDWLSGLSPDAWPSPDLRAIRIFDPADPKSLLASEATNALDEFDKAESAEERDKRWSVPYGTELLRIQGYRRDLAVYYDLGRAMSVRLAELSLRVPVNATSMPVFAALADAWAGSVIETPKMFSDRKEAIDSSIKLLSKFIRLERETRRVAEDAAAAGEAFVKRAAALRELLLGEGADETMLADIDTKLRALQLEIAEAGQGQLVAAGESEFVPGSLDLGRFRERLAPAVNEAASASLRQRLKDDEWWVNTVVALFVVLSWVATVYLVNEKFGSLADYLGALLYGITLTELLKLASRLPLREVFGRRAAN